LDNKRTLIEYLYVLLTLDQFTAALIFVNAILDNVDFNNVNLTRIMFQSTSFINASFVKSNLRTATFLYLLMMNVNFSYSQMGCITFDETQLQYADLTGAIITDEQLSQTLYLIDTILPNGTMYHQKNHLINGEFNDEFTYWNISGNISMKTFPNSNVNYIQGRNNASISQRINITRYGSFVYASDYCISLYYTNNLAIHPKFDLMNSVKYLHKKR